MPVLFPPPIVVQLEAHASPRHGWTSYVTPPSLWRAADVPVKVAFTGGLPGVLDDAAVASLDVASRAWSLPPCSAASFETLGVRALVGDGAHDGRNDVIVHATAWPTELGPGALAQTILYTMGDRIVEADIHLNAKEYALVVTAPFDSGRFDLRAVLTHELGHVLGIGHSADVRATMAAGLPAGIAARSLEDDDLAAICALYPASPTPTVKGCDVGAPCPSGFACIGHQCERPGESGTYGGNCDSVSSARRCEGAGDRARCVSTSIGERCAIPCTKQEVSDPCGTGVRCVAVNFEGDTDCLPNGADPIFGKSDAGADAQNDATADAGRPAPPSIATEGGCGFAAARRGTSRAPARNGGPMGALTALAVGILSRRRRAF